MRVSRGLLGLGDGCPSMEQLNGIVDSSDPCQAEAPCYPSTFVGPLPPGGVYCGAPAASSSGSNAACPGFMCSGASGKTVAMVLGGIVLVLVLTSGGGRR